MTPDLGKHGIISTRDALISQVVYVRFLLAFDMCLVEGVVEDSARNAICKFRDASLDKVVNVV